MSPVTETLTIARRNLRKSVRVPMLLFMSLFQPLLFEVFLLGYVQVHAAITKKVSLEVEQGSGACPEPDFRSILAAITVFKSVKAGAGRNNLERFLLAFLAVVRVEKIVEMLVKAA